MVESRKIVWKETAIVLVGVAVLSALMVGIYWLLGRYSFRVLYSAAAGTVLATANFFAMAVVVTLAADRAEKQDVAGGQKLVKRSYPMRFLALALVLIGCAKSGVFELLPLALPLLLVRPAMFLAEFFRKKEGA